MTIWHAKGVQDRRFAPKRRTRALVDADLDTLATALYVTTDDLLRMAPQRAPWRPAIGIAPRVSDADPVGTNIVIKTEPGPKVRRRPPR